MFLSYLLVQRLISGQPTVYRVSDDTCYLFDQHACGKKVNINTLFELDENAKRELWILTDEALTHPNWTRAYHSWFVVLAASPEKTKASRQWQKDRNADVHYISNWNWTEIFATFRYATNCLFPPTHY